MTGIYKITEIATGLCYIGQSKRIEQRWLEHHKRFPLYRFTYSVLIECPVEDLNRFEIDFISRWDSHRNGFNGTIGGTSIKATHPDTETRRKIGEKSRDRTHSLASIEKMKGNTNAAGAKGKTVSLQTRENIRASRVGMTHSPAACASMKAAWILRRERKRQEKLKGITDAQLQA
jgi:hypothetical protein